MITVRLFIAFSRKSYLFLIKNSLKQILNLFLALFFTVKLLLIHIVKPANLDLSVHERILLTTVKYLLRFFRLHFDIKSFCVCIRCPLTGRFSTRALQKSANFSPFMNFEAFFIWQQNREFSVYFLFPHERNPKITLLLVIFHALNVSSYVCIQRMLCFMRMLRRLKTLKVA